MDEAALVCEHNGLGPIVKAELGEDPGDVSLDRGITDDEGAALALHRRRLERYVLLPNYRNYWHEAGYGEEMRAIEQALAENRRDDIPHYLTDRWIADNTLYGSAAKVRDQLAAWYAAGLNTPVLVPNSVNGNQLTALDEIFSAFE